MPNETSEDLFKSQLREWVFGSEDFLRHMIQLAEGQDEVRPRSTSQHLRSVCFWRLLLEAVRARA